MERHTVLLIIFQPIVFSRAPFVPTLSSALPLRISLDFLLLKSISWMTSAISLQEDTACEPRERPFRIFIQQFGFYFDWKQRAKVLLVIMNTISKINPIFRFFSLYFVDFYRAKFSFLPALQTKVETFKGGKRKIEWGEGTRRLKGDKWTR